MTHISIHVTGFVDELVRLGTAFTFSKNGEFLVLKAGESAAIPFWSSPTKVEIIQAFFADYDDYKISSMSLREFYDWLPEVGEQDLHVVLNLSGKNMGGFDIAPKELRKLLAREIESQSGEKEK